MQFDRFEEVHREVLPKGDSKLLYDFLAHKSIKGKPMYTLEVLSKRVMSSEGGRKIIMAKTGTVSAEGNLTSILDMLDESKTISKTIYKPLTSPRQGHLINP
jgi:hypothetical protein